MKIEQLERFEKYYLPDKDISPVDFEYIMANSQEVKRHNNEEDYVTNMVYDIRDYFSIYSYCSEIDNNEIKYLFSARYRFIKYKKETEHQNSFVDFTKVLFDPQGDDLSHTVKVGDYTFSIDLPFQYNFLILLLKWSDMKMKAGEFPIDNQITASPVFISKDIHNRFGLDVDLNSRLPLTVGYGEYSILDYHRVLPARPACGGLCFYIGDYFKPCISINDYEKMHEILKPTPRLSVFESPYLLNGKSFKGYDFRSTSRVKTILGNEDDLILYVFLNELDEERILKLQLFSLKDYYSVAAWLIVTLSYCFCSFDEKYIQINNAWPSCSILQSHMAKNFLKADSAKRKTPQYVKVLRTYYTSILEVLKEYNKVQANEYTAQHQSLDSLFKAECVAIVYAFSKYCFVPYGMNILNELMETNYDLDVYKAMRKQTAIAVGMGLKPSELVEYVHTIDLVAMALKKLDVPIAQAIIQFYKLLGYVSIDICLSGEAQKDECTEMLKQWVDSHQKYIDTSKDEDLEKFIKAFYDSCEQNSGEHIISKNVDTFDSSSVDSNYQIDDNTSTNKEPNCPSDARNELDSLIGLDSIKADVINMISLVKIQQLRKSKGFKAAPVSLHLVFTGNPGTGKTTVARILAQLYKEIGVLKTGQVVEVDRADLVAGYVGQTALKTQEKIKEAMGGVLFIDEAYTLAKEGNDFGQEAIDTILKEMEDHRGEFIVIVAGYEEPMKKFIDSNPGLKSRFNKYFHFPDYSADELVTIFKTMLQKYDYSISKSAMNIVTEKITKMEQQKEPNFANARTVRNYFEQIIARQALRVSEIPSPTDAEILEITADDVSQN